VAVILLALAVMDMSGFSPTALAYLADIAGMTEHGRSAMGVSTLLFRLGSAVVAGVGGIRARALAINALVIGTAVLVVIALGGIDLLSSRG